MRLTLSITTSALLVLSACGGTPQRAAMPDVASTDQSADDMGLPAAAPTDSDAAEPAPSDPPPTDTAPVTGEPTAG
jgi:hypothetical protein